MSVLLEHQRVGVAWLAARKRAMLCDEQGLGKTVTAIAAADRVRADRLLVVAPSVVAWNWRREIEKWSPWRRVQVVEHGQTKLGSTGLVDAIVVPHSLLLSGNIRAQLVRQDWDVVVLDEAHNFRNPSAKRTRAFFGQPRKDFPSVAGRGRRVWTLSGTPMPNNPTELWTHLAAFGATDLSWSSFRSRFCVLSPTRYGDGWRVVGSRNREELRALLAPLMLRRLKADVLKSLPPIRHETLVLSPRVPPAGLRDLEKKLGVPPGAADFDAMMICLRDHAAHFASWRRLCGIAKADAVVDLLDDELASGALRKVVVFAHHSDVVDALASGLDRFGVRKIVGASNAQDRQRAVDDFQTRSDVRVMVANLVAGGVGVTLTAASEVIMVESSWVPGDNEQAPARVHRFGQTEPVRVRVCALANSIDELLTAALARKLRMIREVLT